MMQRRQSSLLEQLRNWGIRPLQSKETKTIVDHLLDGLRWCRQALTTTTASTTWSASNSAKRITLRIEIHPPLNTKEVMKIFTAIMRIFRVARQRRCTTAKPLIAIYQGQITEWNSIDSKLESSRVTPYLARDPSTRACTEWTATTTLTKFNRTKLKSWSQWIAHNLKQSLKITMIARFWAINYHRMSPNTTFQSMKTCHNTTIRSAS